jgi:lipopolysaccharide transport system permease protein
MSYTPPPCGSGHPPRRMPTAITNGLGAASLWRHRQLLGQMVRREVAGRYRGSVLGLLWSFFNPVLMLAVYTFVFSIIFQAKWGGQTGSRAEFAVILFAGLIVFNLFAEVVSRAPGLILGNVNLVKKVVFPLEILPVVAIGSAFFHAVVSLIVLLAFKLLIGSIPWTVALLPVVLAPLLLLVVGIAWFLAALGVYLRDVSQTVGIAVTALLFLSPIFFPAAAFPEVIRPYMFLNPLTLIIEECRAVLIWGRSPQWPMLGLYTLIALAVALAGLAFFQKSRRGFADVL